MKKTLLVYRLRDIENYSSIINILALMNIELYEINEQMIHLKIKDIINRKTKKKKNQSFPMPMLVFSGMTGEDIDVLLKAFKNGNVPFIPLKAMVTATNLNWSFDYLYHHVYEEYKNVMQKHIK